MNESSVRYLLAVDVVPFSTGRGKTFTFLRAALAAALRTRDSVRDLWSDSVDSGVLLISFRARSDFVPYRASFGGRTDCSRDRILLKSVTDSAQDHVSTATITVAVALSDGVLTTLRKRSRSLPSVSDVNDAILMWLLESVVRLFALVIVRVLAALSKLVKAIVFLLVMIAVSLRFGGRQDSSDHRVFLLIRRFQPSVGTRPASVPTAW